MGCASDHVVATNLRPVVGGASDVVTKLSLVLSSGVLLCVLWLSGCFPNVPHISRLPLILDVASLWSVHYVAGITICIDAHGIGGNFGEGM